LKEFTWLLKQCRSNLDASIHYLLLKLRQGSTGNFRKLATDIISIKTNKEQGQKRSGGAVLYCTSNSKERSLLQPYIAVTNNQEYSNEELVMYNCHGGRQ
jgi:hypothetical protein